MLRSRRTAPGVTTALLSSLLLLLLLSGCSLPPKTPQQIMRDATTPAAVEVNGTLTQVGAEAVLGDVAVRVEAARRSEPSDLTRASLDDSLALIAATSADVAGLATRVEAAAKEVGALTGPGGVRVAAPPPAAPGAPNLGVTVRATGKAAERVRAQAHAVERGAKLIGDAAEVVAGAAELARLLGVLMGDPNDDTQVRIAADARGVPHRASCLLREERLREERPTLSCTIVRADVPATTVWHLNVGTSDGSLGDALPPARGWLRAEPAAGRAPLWITRPDATATALGRSDYDDFSAFAVSREQVPVARVRVRDAFGPTTAWIPVDRGGLDRETSDTLDVGLAILALVPWPMLKPDPEAKDGG